ncbi:MAG: phosphoribosylanthranilate isomerase [Oscillospiraceae bacterium]|jgi:phosphoribosylanthranilate isomerase|nr:phosphoribosylanthranilate isomerase [Oscillospiraceae bacterium]
MPKIKICGLWRERDIEYANEAGPDYVGFVFAESRRRVTPARAAALRARLRPGIIPVGVFVDAAAEEIAALCRGGVIEAVQLHGHETNGDVAALKARCRVPIIRAVRVGEGGGPCAADPGAADFLLFDSGAGSGRPFDWRRLTWVAPATHNPNSCFLSPLRGNKVPKAPRAPYFLAGGIGLHNLAGALALGPYGVDISSGAETGGVKDLKKMRALVEELRIES